MAFIHFMPVVQSQDAINRELYRRADLVNEYAKIELHPPEAVALVRYRDDIQSRRVLDLGCGAGRLAMYLRPLTRHYFGLDVSEHMVAYCAEHFPELAFQRADMRQLPFATGVFDTVFALFNLMDAVSHEARLHCLGEIQRVLKPGGLLVFASHNRRWKKAGVGPKLELRWNPISQLRAVTRYLRSHANRRRLQPSQCEATDYALCNDDAHEFALLHYYITRDAQTRQLRDAGFQLLECLDENGQTLGSGDDDSTFSSLHYVARSMGPR